MKLMSLQELKEQLQRGKKCYIPLYQRNYKWTASSTEKNGAAKLIQDIINKYNEDTSNHSMDFNLGMITTYKDKQGNVQILDGQQRLITLSLIMKALGKADASNWIELHFERDEGFDSKTECDDGCVINSCIMPRYQYIYRNIDNSESVDVQRMKINFKAIEQQIQQNDDLDKSILYRYIMDHVKILLHETTREPIDEFLNMNFNKTPFCAADYMKANLIFDTIESDKKNGNAILASDIMKLWKKLQHVLYQLENVLIPNDKLENDMFQLIKQHYTELDKNRMEILFEDRYYQLDEKNSSKKKINCESYYKKRDRLKSEYEQLEKSYYIMQNLLEELVVIDAEGKYHPNYTAYSAYNLLCKKNPGITFFGLFKESDKVSDTLYKEFNLTKQSYYKLHESYINVNQFMEAMLISSHTTGENDTIKKISYNSQVDIENFEVYKNYFNERFEEFTNMIDVAKRTEEPVFSAGNKQITIQELFSSNKIKQIKIPQVQRDYVMGSSGDYLERYLTKIRFEELCLRGENFKSNPNCTSVVSATIDGSNYSLNCEDIITLYKKIVINRNREDLSNSKNFFNNQLLPKSVEPKEGGRQNRFNELNTWLGIMEKQPIKAPANYKSSARGSALGNSLSFRNDICEKLQECHDAVITSTSQLAEFKDKMNTSCIMGHCDEYGTFWIYDGQQRITTSIILLAYALKNMEESEEKKRIVQMLNKYSFESRDGANQILKTIIMQPDIDVSVLQTYIEDNTSYAIYTLWSKLNSENNENDWGEYRKISSDFLLKGMDFEFVLMEQIEDAEQLFMEMNEGLALTPDEKYKAELNHMMQEMKYRNRIEFSRKMDNKWINDCKTEECEVKWLQYAITMAYFEKNGYDCSRKWSSLVGITEEILNFVNEKFDYQEPYNCPKYKYEKWCDTLEFEEHSSFYSDRIKLNKKDFLDLLAKIYNFVEDENLAYVEIFSLISVMRTKGYISVNDSDSSDQSETSKLVYRLIKNRQDRYLYYNSSQWENLRQFPVDNCSKDYNFEDACKKSYSFSAKYEISLTDSINNACILNMLKVKDILWAKSQEKKDDIQFSLTLIDEVLQQLKDNNDEGCCYFIRKLKDAKKEKIEPGNRSEDSDVQRWKTEIKMSLDEIAKDIVLNFNSLNDSNKKLIYELGIELGYYKYQDGMICRRSLVEACDDSCEIKNFLPCPSESIECELKPQYSDLLFVLKNCKEELKEQIKTEIVEEYLSSINNNSVKNKYAFQTKLFFEEKCNNCSGCKSKEKCDNCTQIYENIKNKDDIDIFNLLKVITSQMAQRLSVEEKWKEESGVYNEYKE